MKQQPDYQARLTLRRLIELVGEEYLDVPLTIGITDPHGNSDILAINEQWPSRAKAQPEYSDPGRFCLQIYTEKSLVKRAKK